MLGNLPSTIDEVETAAVNAQMHSNADEVQDRSRGILDERVRTQAAVRRL
jgi:hypothetical protein